MVKKIIVYSTESCPACHSVKDFLNSRGIKFEEVDVGADREAAEKLFAKTGQGVVPQIEIDGKMIIGFDRDAIEEELG